MANGATTAGTKETVPYDPAKHAPKMVYWLAFAVMHPKGEKPAPWMVELLNSSLSPATAKVEGDGPVKVKLSRAQLKAVKADSMQAHVDLTNLMESKRPGGKGELAYMLPHLFSP